jgi:opacity protein-like surface antigen
LIDWLTRATAVALQVAAITLATLTSTNGAHAQSSARSNSARIEERKSTSDDGRTRGFVLGVHSIAAPGISITGDDIDGEFRTNFGMGAGVTLGYGFSRTLTAFASLDVAKQKFANTDYENATFGLGHLEAGLRANVPLGTPTTLPYLSASIGRRAVGAHVYDTVLEEEYDMSVTGMSYGIGAGVERFFSPSMSLDLGVSANFGKFNKFESDNEKATAEVNGSRTIRMRVGVNWRPGARSRS